MLIKKLQFQNFKRFADLTIDPDPENTGKAPKLVLLIGANGSGKSCVFDGFEVINSAYRNKHFGSFKMEPTNFWFNSENFKYFGKNSQPFDIKLYFEKQEITFHRNHKNEIDFQTDLENSQNTDIFYGRTAFRHLPEITKTQIGGSPEIIYPRSVDYDYENSYRDMDIYFGKLLEQIQNKQGNLAEEFTNKLQTAFKNIFGTNSKTSLAYKLATSPIQSEDGKPATPINFLFEKNNSEIGFTNLSAGEKQVFLILFNLFNREIHTAKDKIIYFDELDAHLNTSLQKNLLKEITENWIPEGCQLWVASHSLGFIEYTREYEQGAIIDLDNLDFDRTDLPPLRPKQASEFDVYDVVFDLENPLLKAKFVEFLKFDTKIIVCEGSNQKSFAKFNIPKVIFTDKYGKNTTNKKAVIEISKNEGIFGLIDRDYLTEEEIFKLKTENERLLVLDFYCFENYLYHPENVLEIQPNLNINDYKVKITELKNLKLDKLVTNIALSRNSYKILENQEIIVKKALESDVFEIYYPFLNINFIDKSLLVQTFSLPNENQLTQTTWFKSQIEKILR